MFPLNIFTTLNHTHSHTLDHVRDKLKQLEQCVSFKHIHDLFVSCEYSPVVDKLLPILEQDSGPPLEVHVYKATD